MKRGKLQKMEEEFEQVDFFQKILKCPECDENLLLATYVEAENDEGIIEVEIDKIPQGDCAKCVYQRIPEYEGIIGEKYAAWCARDDYGEGQEDEEAYPQHTWTFKEYQEGVNKQTWRSIVILKEAGIKNLKCIEFIDRAEARKRREKLENNCNWCGKDLRKQPTRWDLICESSEKLPARSYTRDFELSSGKLIIGWIVPRGVALQAFGIDFVFTIGCCSEKCAQKLKEEVQGDEHIKKIIRLTEVEEEKQE